MSHDVYICCDEKDQKFCDAIFDVFEGNGIESWVKSRHFMDSDSVDKITNTIADSKCFILIHSENSNDSNYVVTETDIAFSRDVPIVIFNIDDSRIGGNMEYILQDATEIPAFPYPKRQLRALVKETSRIIGKPIDNVKVDFKSARAFDRINPKSDKVAVRKYVKIAVIAVVALALVYFLVVLPMGQHSTDDGTFTMNVTKVDVNGLKYTVYGESYNMPSDSDEYFMNLQFFDKNENMVYEVNSTANEFKSGVIWSGNLHDDNATHVGFRLSDLDGKVLSQEDYKIS